MGKREDIKESQTITDAKLRFERERADEELLERSSALGEDADAVIQRARERARLVLDLAREREDRALASHADAGEKAAVIDARRVADDVTAVEYAAADAPLFDERSKRRRALLQLLALERDETDRMLVSERAFAADLLAARDDMLGVVSHDLRSHLSAMLVRTSLVLMTTLEPSVLAENMEAVQRSIAQMDKLVSDLLDVASMEAGRMRVERVTTDLAAVVADEVRVHRPAAEARSITITLDGDQEPLLVEIDAARMSRVLMNVLTNALKFTPHGGRIDVVIARHDQEASVSVKDSGPGIPAEHLEAVFERFRRVDAKTRGYGLGLYIARAIVQAHGGRIFAESKAGEGATFHIRIPTRGITEQ